MGWTTPVDTRATGYTVGAPDWDAVQDNLLFLYGDTGWTTAIVSGLNWSAGSPAPRFMLQGRTVHMQGLVSGAAGATTGTTLFTLPAGYQPTVNLFFATCSGASGASYGLLEITSGGAVSLFQGTAANSSVSLCCSFSVV